MPLDLADTLARSASMSGPLGAVAFVCLEAVEHGGGSAEELAAARALLFRTFAALTDADCEVLADVAHARLRERPEGGRWYGGTE